MELREIEKKLLKAGYRAYIKETIIDGNTVKYIIGGVPDETTTLNMNTAFQVFLAKEKISLNYLNAQTTVEKDFSNTDGLLDFIKTKFPVESK